MLSVCCPQTRALRCIILNYDELVVETELFIDIHHFIYVTLL